MKTLELVKRHESPPKAVGDRRHLSTDILSAEREPGPFEPALILLPYDRPRPATGYRGAAETIAIPSDLVESLDSLGRHGVRSDRDVLFAPVLAAFIVLLHRYSRESHILVGITATASGPKASGGDEGLFGGAVPVRIDLVDDPRFHEVLEQVGRASREILDAPGCLSDAALRSLDAKTRREDISYFQFESHFSLGPRIGVETKSAALDGLAAAGLERPVNELTLWIARQTRELDCTLEYNSELFDAATVRRMLGQLQALLHAVAANPDERISVLPLMTITESRSWSQPGSSPLPKVNRASKRECLSTRHSRIRPSAHRAPWRLSSARVPSLIASLMSGRTNLRMPCAAVVSGRTCLWASAWRDHRSWSSVCWEY